jgi:hypothetical protein
MKIIFRFTIKLTGVFIFLVFATLSIFTLIPPDPNNFWGQLMIEKKTLLENSHAPRIILVGGSSTALGIDCKELCEKTHLKVINEGMHGGMSLRLILQNVYPYLEQGDIVILPLEYDLYYRNLNGETRSMAGIIEVMPSIISTFDFQQMIQLPEIFVALIQIKLERSLDNIIHKQVDSAYNAQHIFDPYGDFVSHLGKSYSGVIPNNPLIEKNAHLNHEAIDEIKRFKQLAENKQVKIYLAFPPARITNCRVTTDKTFTSFYTELVQEVDLPILSFPTQSCYPDDYFYDTVYHLNEKGREVNTNRMVELIQNVTNDLIGQ